jgi:glucose-1-phosphate cytidylyltransferase
MEVHDGEVEPWRVTLVDTGADTQTGGRVKRVAEHLGDETFLLTYGDGVADVDITALLACHRAHGRLATVTAVQPLGRFGALELDDDQRVTSFTEKPAGDGAWVNGGFFVLEPGALDYIAGDDTYFEHEPLERLARDGELRAYRHRGFWQPMDVLRDKNHLEELWQSGKAPWRVW